MKFRTLKITASIASTAVLSSMLTAINPQVVNAITNSKDSISINQNEKEIQEVRKMFEKEIQQGKIKPTDTLKGKMNKGLGEEDPDEKVRVIVELEAPSASNLSGNAKNSTKAQIASVIEKQKNTKKQVEIITGTKVRKQYGNIINGFSIVAKKKDIKRIKKVNGVLKVTEVKEYKPVMANAKQLTQNINIWANEKYKGEGLVVSIIDTGIDWKHNDMKDPSDSTKLKIKQEFKDGKGKWFSKKIPYGYNFADNNENIKDEEGSMHGMHVAGIVAADGDPLKVSKQEAVQGVAPEAQLLAMKVFSNDRNTQGAFSDDIVAAIEKSIELKADVINMSLGSTAGFVASDDPEQQAIKKASDAGVICVVAAGNEATSTDPFVFKNQKDVATVGSPGVATEAIEVASFENSKVILNALTVKAKDGEVNIGYQGVKNQDPNEMLKGKELEIVDCGYGQEEDFKNKDLKNKIALIQRGKITFSAKISSAQERGAEAVIIYNGIVGNKPQNDYISMAVDSNIKIPAIFITHDDGEKLKDNLGIKVNFQNKKIEIYNTKNGSMSDFTSWGPTPSLDFAPEITAPGGNIYSTLNDNKFGNMSGTSMAAPNTSGLAALILQGIKDKNLNLSGKELTGFVKRTMINTAKILEDKDGVPYSPRRQGAGLIQAEDALKNSVIATGEDEESTISLKEMGNEKTFQINLKNYGDKDETYEITAPGGVLTSYVPEESLEQIMNHDVKLEGGKIEFSTKEITVPAKSNIKFSVKLTLDNSVEKDNFIEGYIKLINKNITSPSLTIPYMGFYGDWSKERIIAPMLWEEAAKDYSFSSYVAVVNDKDKKENYSYAGDNGKDEEGNQKVDVEKIAISPNDDGYSDFVIPTLYLLRNAKDITIDLLDKDGKLISKNINKEISLRKKVIGNPKGQEASPIKSLSWDGKIYNKTKGKYETVPDGKYYLKINSKIDYNNSKVQEDKVPIKVDTVAPTINIIENKLLEDKSYEIKFTVKEENSGLFTESPKLTLNEYVEDKDTKKLNLEVNEEKTEELNKSLKKDGDVYIAKYTPTDNTEANIKIGAIDNAQNVSSKLVRLTTKEGSPQVIFKNFHNGFSTKQSGLDVKGRAEVNISKLIIDGQEVKINEDGTFKTHVNFKEGTNVIHIREEYNNGKEPYEYSFKVQRDNVKPILVVNSPNINLDNEMVFDNNNLMLKVYVADDQNGYKLSINGSVVKVVNVDGKSGEKVTGKVVEIPFTFTDNSLNELKSKDNLELTLKNKEIIELKAEDESGNVTSLQYKIIINKDSSASKEEYKTKFPNVPKARITGKNRIDTSLKIADKMLSFQEWKDSKKAILAPSDNNNLVDALAASTLSFKMKAPIYLSTNKDTIDKDTIDKIVNSKVDELYVVSGEGIISEASLTALRDKGIKITRLGGKNRVETSKNIYEKVKDSKEVFVVSYNGLPDALSVASIAAKKGIPILMANADGSLDVDLTGKKVYVLGGEKVISNSAVDKLKGERIAGKDRYETNAKVIEKFKDNFKTNRVVIVNGLEKHLVDALTASPYAAISDSLILLGNSKLENSQKSAIKGLADDKTVYIILGGEAISESFVDDVIENSIIS